MKASRSIGVSFLQGRLQVAEVEHGKKQQTVTCLAERDSTMNISQEAANLSPAHPQLATFASELQGLLKAQKLEGETISFALPPDSVFINIIPVDPSLTGAARTEYLQWELLQYHPAASAKDFVIDSHQLPLEDSGAAQSFMVGVRRNIAAFLQKAAGAVGRKLNIIDIDQFSTEKTLIANYPEILEFDIVLFGIRSGGVEGSLIHNGQMTDYRAYRYTGAPDPLKFIAAYLKYVKDRYAANQPAGVLLHGVDVTDDLVKTIRKDLGLKQTVALNALRKLKAEKGLYKPFVSESYRFASAIGLALRS
jgi:Tfp pilus assembly PilM family ATPase